MFVNEWTNRGISIPKVLKLSADGTPTGWLTYEDFATLKSRNRILWSTGNYALTLRGGFNAKTGKQSTLDMETIVAVKSGKNQSIYDRVPVLTNYALFARDHYLCAYCGHVYPFASLSRDHVVPVCKDGKNDWENVVTACKACNHWKADKSLEEADLTLLYVPYKPSFAENLILSNRNILEDQMELLIKNISPHSRIYKDFTQSKIQ